MTTQRRAPMARPWTRVHAERRRHNAMVVAQAILGFLLVCAFIIAAGLQDPAYLR